MFNEGLISMVNKEILQISNKEDKDLGKNGQNIGKIRPITS